MASFAFSLQTPLRTLPVVLVLASPVLGQNAVPTTSGAAPSEESAAEALQKTVQNPVASLISVPLANNTNTVNLTAQFYGNAAYPTGTSSLSMRAQIAFLFPKLTPGEKKLMMEQQLKKLEQEQQKAPEKK